MGLTLTITSPRAYVKAVSGLFISPKYPMGLTIKEIDILARLMEHSPQGALTQKVRNKVMEDLNFTPQNFWNTMTSLRKKKAISRDELHKIFTAKTIKIHYALRSTDR